MEGVGNVCVGVHVFVSNVMSPISVFVLLCDRVTLA